MKVLHIITALNVGGAETMLAKLLEQERRNASADESHVLSLMAPGKGAARIEAIGIPCHSLNMQHGMPRLRHLRDMQRIVSSVRPDLIMGWMYHGQLAASLATTIQRRRIPVIWNVRHSVHDLRHEKMATRILLRLGALFSRFPRAIVYNSNVAAAQYRKIGYYADREIIIPNGFDGASFKPDAQARARLSRRFRIDPAALIVGMFARAHPMKDPFTLLRAALRAREEGADIHLLIAGEGMDRPPAEMAELTAGMPENRITLLGHRSDIGELLPGLDALALPSAWGEGFPNILGEAMLCGVPCVATDIGDSRWIIGDTGRTVPPRAPEVLAQALLDLADMNPEQRRHLGHAARQRIEELFSIAAVSGQYTQLYRDVIGGGRARQTHQGLNGAARTA